ncbi:MAG: hypothetical protein AAF202_11290, partial [Pseudomonadota bacterium]
MLEDPSSQIEPTPTSDGQPSESEAADSTEKDLPPHQMISEEKVTEETPIQEPIAETKDAKKKRKKNRKKGGSQDLKSDESQEQSVEDMPCTDAPKSLDVEETGLEVYEDVAPPTDSLVQKLFDIVPELQESTKFEDIVQHAELNPIDTLPPYQTLPGFVSVAPDSKLPTGFMDVKPNLELIQADQKVEKLPPYQLVEEPWIETLPEPTESKSAKKKKKKGKKKQGSSDFDPEESVEAPTDGVSQGPTEVLDESMPHVEEVIDVEPELQESTKFEDIVHHWERDPMPAFISTYSESTKPLEPSAEPELQTETLPPYTLIEEESVIEVPPVQEEPSVELKSAKKKRKRGKKGGKSDESSQEQSVEDIGTSDDVKSMEIDEWAAEVETEVAVLQPEEPPELQDSVKFEDIVDQVEKNPPFSLIDETDQKSSLVEEI